MKRFGVESENRKVRSQRSKIHNPRPNVQLSQAFRAVEAATDDKTKGILQTNVEFQKRRITSFDEIERSVKLVEGHRQSIESMGNLGLLPGVK